MCSFQIWNWQSFVDSFLLKTLIYTVRDALQLRRWTFVWMMKFNVQKISEVLFCVSVPILPYSHFQCAFTLSVLAEVKYQVVHCTIWRRRRRSSTMLRSLQPYLNWDNTTCCTQCTNRSIWAETQNSFSCYRSSLVKRADDSAPTEPSLMPCGISEWNGKQHSTCVQLNQWHHLPKDSLDQSETAVVFLMKNN